MDITSYLLGKKAGGGGSATLQTKQIEVTSNGSQDITADTGYDGLSKDLINKEEKGKEEQDLSNELTEKEFIEINEDISKALIEMKKEKDNSEDNTEEEEKEFKNVDIKLFSSNNLNNNTKLMKNDSSNNTLKDNKFDLNNVPFSEKKNINNLNNINLPAHQKHPAVDPG